MKQSGFSIYTVISILAFLALVFILVLPQMFDLDENEKREESIKNMKTIYKAVQSYMEERQTDFTGGDKDLVRTGYLKKTLSVPGGKPGDKYLIRGIFETGVVSVTSPVADQFPDHKLPEDW